MRDVVSPLEEPAAMSVDGDTPDLKSLLEKINKLSRNNTLTNESEKIKNNIIREFGDLKLDGISNTEIYKNMWDILVDLDTKLLDEDGRKKRINDVTKLGILNGAAQRINQLYESYSGNEILDRMGKQIRTLLFNVLSDNDIHVEIIGFPSITGSFE